MSMGDAVRAIRERIPEWMMPGQDEKIEPPVIKTPQEDMSEVSRMAGNQGVVDKTSVTWLAISSWASRELLAALTELETANGKEVIELQARIKAMRDLLELENPPAAPIKMKSSAPYVP